MMGYHCSTCGTFHTELPMCFGAPAPALWYEIPESERAVRTILSSDQCIVDYEHFFILGRILIPVHGNSEPFVWLAWVSLSEPNFNRASELWQVSGREAEPAYFGWLQSALPYSPSTLGLKTSVQTQPLGEKPLIALEPTDHPLSVDQQYGITLQRVQQIAEEQLHGQRTQPGVQADRPKEAIAGGST